MRLLGGETYLKKISKAVLLSVVTVLAFSLGGMYIVSAETQDSIETNGKEFFSMRGWGMHFRGAMGALSEEQRNELISEIQDLVSSKFEEWGIELPEPLLSEEQRSDLQAGIEELRETGATQEEIREFIAEKLEEYGVELPELPAGLGRFQGGRECWKQGFSNSTS